MRSRSDRIRQAVSLEIIGVLVVTPLFAVIFGHPMDEIGALAFFGATAASLWNYVYNLAFDHLLHWRTGSLRKSLMVRILHAMMFEATLLVLLLPLFAWWLGITLLAAMVMDLSFAAFYVVYVFLFTWGYDRLFPPGGPMPVRSS